MKKNRSIFTVVLALALALGCLTGCGQTATTPQAAPLPEGGTLFLKVNPEIAVTYDANGLVTEVTARNDDGGKILETYADFVGKECRTVVSELVNAIGEAGYFVEEIEGKSRQITIEVESGSWIPSETFLDDVVADVRTTVSNNSWRSPVAVEGGTVYGKTDYADTDYGPNNDGITDYLDTDYGPNNDGITDYNDGNSNYGNSNYGNSNYGNSNYGNSDYGDSGYGD